MDAQIKKWSVGMPNQAVLDSLEVIIAKHKPKVEEIKSITISLPNRRFHISDNVLMPNICTQHLASIMLLDSTMTFATAHNEARMKANDVIALRKRITLVPSDALSKAKPMRQAIVEIELLNGEKLKHRTRAVHGTPQKPMTRDDIEAKSLDLIAPIVGKDNAGKLFKTVWSLEKVKDMGELRPLLQA
jgi:2-methylcitrate dehydratase PrpD